MERFHRNSHICNNMLLTHIVPYLRYITNCLQHTAIVNNRQLRTSVGDLFYLLNHHSCKSNIILWNISYSLASSMIIYNNSASDSHLLNSYTADSKHWCNISYHSNIFKGLVQAMFANMPLLDFTTLQVTSSYRPHSQSSVTKRLALIKLIYGGRLSNIC